MTGVAAAVASVPTKSTFFRVLIVRLAFCAEGVLTIPEGATPAATPRRLTRRDTLAAFGDLAAPPSHFGLTIQRSAASRASQSHGPGSLCHRLGGRNVLLGRRGAEGSGSAGRY